MTRSRVCGPFLVFSLVLFSFTSTCFAAPSAETDKELAQANYNVAAGKYKDAVASLNAALATTRSPADHLALSQSLANSQLSWGNVLLERGNATQALDHYLAGVSIARAVRNRDYEAKLLLMVGVTYEEFGRYDKALTYDRQALTKAKVSNQRAIEERSLGVIGDVYGDLGQFKKALEYDPQALVISREIADIPNEENFLRNIGIAYISLQQFDNALDYEQQALVIARKFRDTADEKSFLGNIGNIYKLFGKYDLALDCDQQALLISKEIHDKADEGKFLNAIGIVYENLGRYDKALDYYQEALVIAEEAKDKAEAGKIVRNIGNVRFAHGEYGNALVYDQEALATSVETKDRAGEESDMGNIGAIYADLGQYDMAVGYDQRALAIAREIKDTAEEEKFLANTGTLYGYLGQYDKALDYDKRALMIDKRIKVRADEEAELGNIGTVYGILGQYDSALDYERQALSFARMTKDKADEQAVLCNIGMVYTNCGQYANALDYEKHALTVAMYIKARAAEEKVMANLGIVYTDLGQYDKALNCDQLALETSREIQDRVVEANVLDDLMVLWAAQNRPRLATYYGKQAVQMYESIRVDAREIGPEARRSYLETVQDTYRTLAEILVQQGDFSSAEQVLGKLKGEELMQFVIKGPEASLPATTDIQYNACEQPLVDKDLRLFDLITLILGRITLLERQMPLTAADQAKVVDQQTQLSAAVTNWNDFQASLPDELMNTPSGVATPSTEASPVQKALLRMPVGTVVVYSIVLPEYTRLVVVTPKTETARNCVVAEQDLRKLVLNWRAELSKPNGKPDELGEKLYHLLIGPIANDLAQAHPITVMWWLDDVLHYAPMAALTDGHQYLVERFRNTVFTNGSLASTLGQSQGRRVLGLGVSRAHGTEFPKLDGVQAEMHEIVRDETHPDGLMPGDLLLDDQFTASAMYADLDRGYPFVHVASHFQLGPNYAMSRLLLGDGSTLSLQDLVDKSKVFRSVDLLVFSACQTGIGALTNYGHEVESLGSVAQDEGAAGVLASLWPVADESTPVLMEEFYKVLACQKGTDKAAALQKAQLTLLHGNGKSRSKYAHPFYWAPFILMGNWR